MAAIKLLDFSDIYNAVLEELKIQSSDTTTLARIKRDINMIYIHEVVPVKRWWWLYGRTTVKHPVYYADGTYAVNPDSTTVTLSTAPSASLGSFQGRYFSGDGLSEVYKIASHTAGSATVTLETAWVNPIQTASAYKIWQEDLTLPTDCRETVEIRHDRMNVPLEGIGFQQYRLLQSQGPKGEGRPQFYTTYDFYDPSSGDGESETDRYRMLKVYPAISTDATLLHIDYTKEAAALELDGDEPLMPVEDRIVLFYGACARAWARERNPEESARNQQLFVNKLARMMGDQEDSLDTPAIAPSSWYIAGKRGPRIGSLTTRDFGGAGGGSTYTSPTYLKNVTIEGATITANVTVSASITIDGRDISVDGAALDAHIAASSAVHGITGSVVGTTDTQTLTNKTIDADSNTITNIEDADIKAAAAISRSKLASGTASHVLINDGSGVMSSEARLDLSRFADAAANNVLISAGVGSDSAYGKVTDSEIDAAAAITLTKLATVTASRALESDGSGNITASAITATELSYVNDAVPRSSVALNDNQASAADVFTYSSSFDLAVIDYYITRGAGNVAGGTIHIINDGTNTSHSVAGPTDLGTVGVTFTTDISAGSVRLRYTSTSTGTAPTLVYSMRPIS